MNSHDDDQMKESSTNSFNEENSSESHGESISGLEPLVDDTESKMLLDVDESHGSELSPNEAIEENACQKLDEEVNQDSEANSPHNGVEGSLEFDPSQLLETTMNLSDSIAELQTTIRNKIIDDNVRDKIIDNLHKELQEHKRGLVEEVLQPIFQDIIALHDNLGRRIESERSQLSSEKGSEDANPVVKSLETVQLEIEIILERRGVLTFNSEGDHFDGRRQRSVSSIDPDNPDLSGLIHRRMRPGFEKNGTVIRPELVETYRARNPKREQENSGE